MNPIRRLLERLYKAAVVAERERRERYLAGAANRSELEHRMRMLDSLDTTTMRGL